MNIYIRREDLIGKLFPLGTDDLSYTVRADKLYEVIMGMPQYTNMELRSMEKAAIASKAIVAFSEAKTIIPNEALAYPIEHLDLSVRVLNRLHCAEYLQISTIGDLLDIKMDDLKRIRNLGKVGIAEIKHAVSRFTLAFEDEAANAQCD